MRGQRWMMRPGAARVGAVCALVAQTMGVMMAGQTVARAATLNQQLSSATGYAAHEICTRTLLSGDDFTRVKKALVAPAIEPLGLVWLIDHDPAAAQTTVKTWLPWAANPSVAVFRPGLGCTSVPQGVSVESVRAQPLKAPQDAPLTSAQRDAAWPAGEGAASDATLTAAQREAIRQQGQALFAEQSLLPGQRHNTIAYLVAVGGRLVHEAYASGYNANQPQHGWSMTKTLTGLIAGRMVTEGRFALDDHPSLPGWQADGRAAITWRHLLQMGSGLQWAENFGTYGSTAQMMWMEPDQGAYAASQPLANAPGSTFAYSTGNFSILPLAMRRVLGNEAQALYDHQHRQLFAPLGMRQATIEPDVSGTPSGGAYGVLRPRDWLRLGQLVLNRGQWNGRNLIDASYIDFMLTPSPANAGYGGALWLKGSLNMPADLPADTAVFWGLNGQYLVLVPSRQLAVLRMGVSHLDKDFGDNATRQRVFEAVRAILRTL